MKENEHHSDHAKQVIEVAINELETLLKQRTAITMKVRSVKQTVKGLASLFGEDIIGELRLKCIDAGSQVPIGTRIAVANDPLRRVGSDLHKPKLERACRIALVESEQPASAGQIYDRINRRRSYQLRRYKNPLMRVIETLDALVKDGEARTLFVGDCRCWQWNTRQMDVTEGNSEIINQTPLHNDLRSL